MRSGETVTLSDITLESSIHDVKTQYAQKTSQPQERIKLLLNKKPAADLKTLKELGVDGDVEFTVMIMTAGASTPSGQTPATEKADPAASVPSPSTSQVDKMEIDKDASHPGSEKAQAEAESAPTVAPAAGGPGGPGALNTAEFWSDLKDFLAQRLRDEPEAEKLVGIFKRAWINQL